MPYNIPVTGTGYYPTTAQGAINYFTIIHRNFRPGIIDAVFRKKPMFLFQVLKDLSEPVAGGFNPIVQPIFFSDFGAVINAISWTAGVTASPVSLPVVSAQWNMAGYAVVMDTLLPELAMTQGAAAQLVQIDPIVERFTDFYYSLLDAIDSRILSKATNTTDINGLDDAIDDGTTVATYGGLSRSEYPKWAAPVYNAADYSGAEWQTQNHWKAISFFLAKYRANVPGDVPNIVLTSYGVFYKIATSLTNIERVIAATPEEVDFTRHIGMQVLNIEGLYVIPCDKITTPTAYFINGRTFKFAVHPDLVFRFIGPESLLPVEKLGWRCALVFAGQFYCVNPRANFKVNNLPAETL